MNGDVLVNEAHAFDVNLVRLKWPIFHRQMLGFRSEVNSSFIDFLWLPNFQRFALSSQEESDAE